MASPSAPPNAPAPAGMSDADRRRLEAALAAALILIYAGKAQQALARLGLFMRTWRITPAIRQRITAFAADRAALVQTGVNQRLAAAVAALPPGASPAEQRQAQQAAMGEIAAYNANVLMPFLATWAASQALVDVYRGTESSTPGRSVAEAVQWTWTQTTDYPDDCTEADAASPASLDELLAIAGSPPPVHPRCGCTLEPDEVSPDDLPKEGE